LFIITIAKLDVPTKASSELGFSRPRTRKNDAREIGRKEFPLKSQPFKRFEHDNAVAADNLDF
jgi:hypothetical protein